MSAIDIVAKEGQSFIDRHPEIKDNPYAGTGALTFGFMKALLECPNCAGVYRIPSNEDWDELYCPSCKNVWVHKDKIKNNHVQMPITKKIKAVG